MEELIKIFNLLLFIPSIKILLFDNKFFIFFIKAFNEVSLRPNIVIFFIAIASILTGYYHFILTVDGDEDKRIKMVKRVLVLLVLVVVY